jgi:hypothetical protein
MMRLILPFPQGAGGEEYLKGLALHPQRCGMAKEAAPVGWRRFS